MSTMVVFVVLLLLLLLLLVLLLLLLLLILFELVHAPAVAPDRPDAPASHPPPSVAWPLCLSLSIPPDPRRRRTKDTDLLEACLLPRVK